MFFCLFATKYNTNQDSTATMVCAYLYALRVCNMNIYNECHAEMCGIFIYADNIEQIAVQYIS